MNAGPLVRFREVVLPLPGGGSLGPLDWGVGQNARVWVAAEGDGAACLAQALTGSLLPSAGYIEEGVPVVAQSDLNLRETLPWRRSIYELLRQPQVPAYLWLDGRRRPLPLVVDLLGLTPDRTRAPLKQQPQAVVDKFWALRFVLSQATLLVGEEIFRLADPGVRRVLAGRWGHFPGTVVGFGRPEDAPGPVETLFALSPQGELRAQPEPAGGPGPEEG